MNSNKLKYGFRMKKTTSIPECSSIAHEFVHEKTGAKLLYLENKDDNKVFSIAFRTPPADDTGVAHIVEHSVLCGSRKYPLKEPFVELVKGSLNTFLNAMTFPDKTMYPVASQNNKDFQNLMDVYLDAVFYPNIYDSPNTLRQEGWHYEILDKKDPLIYSGVVYNEMKGALSSPEDLLETEILKSLFPETSYAKESGGNPLAIPQLTQEAFTDFHRRYYHPSNSYIYLYGDLDIDEKLKYLDEEYLSRFERLEIDSHIERQKPFEEMKKIVKSYPIGAEEELKGKTFLSYNMVAADSMESKKVMALTILWYALLKIEGAPLFQAIIDAGICRDVSSSIEASICQPYLSITAYNSESEHLDTFFNVIEDTLKKLVENGIDRELLQAAHNMIEFKVREADYGTAPKGLVYNIALLNTWLYDGEATKNLFFEEIFAQLQGDINTGYYEKLIEEVILKNSHKSLITLVPDATLASKREAEMKQMLANIKENLSTDELELLISQTKELKELQQKADSPEALEKIPLLALSDIEKSMKKYPLEEKECLEAKILYTEADTNGIGYIDFFFDARTIPQEKLLYAYLLEEVISVISTTETSHEGLAKKINLNTGGLSFSLTALGKYGDVDACQPIFTVRLKTLIKKLPKALSIVEEILTSTVFTDKKRLKELVSQARSISEAGIMRASNQIMSSRLFSYLTPVDRYIGEGSLEYYWFIKELDEHFDERFDEISGELRTIFEGLFTRKGLIISYTAEKKDYVVFAKEIEPFLKKFSTEAKIASPYKWELKALNEGLLSASQVQYVGKGANFVRLGYEYSGVMNIINTLMRYDYLWTKVRVQGGAYGAFSVFSIFGNMYFGSYRDPRLKETLDVFDKTVEYLSKFDVSEREMTKYIIGTISTLDIPLTPRLTGQVAARNFMTGITDEIRQRIRDEVLSATPEKIREIAPLVSACMKENIICVFGNEAKIKENSTLFGNLVNVLG